MRFVEAVNLLSSEAAHVRETAQDWAVTHPPPPYHFTSKG